MYFRFVTGFRSGDLTIGLLFEHLVSRKNEQLITLQTLIMKCRALIAVVFAVSVCGNTMAADGDIAHAVQLINTKQFGAAAQVLKTLGETGDASAQYHLAGLYYRGQGVARDHERARALYAQASAAGHAGANRAIAENWPNARSEINNNTAISDVLHAAAARGWLAELQQQFDNGAAVDALDTFGQTPLMVAIVNKQTEAAQLLLQAGAVVDSRDRGGESALHKAVRSGHIASVELLLNAGASADAADGYGNTALHFASRYESIEMMRLLLADEPDINAINEEGLTALSLAARHNSASIRTLLKGAGGTTPIVARAAVQRTLQAIDRPVNGASLWFIAAERGSLASLGALRRGGQDINQSDVLGRTALTIGAERGNDELLEWLLERGANPNQPDSDGNLPIAAALRAGHIASAIRLRTKGSKVTDAMVEPALASGSPTVVDWLLAALESTQATPKAVLARAARSNQEALVLHLLRRGAAPDEVDNSGRTALWHAAGLGLAEAVQNLLNAGAAAFHADQNKNTPLHQAAAAGHAEIVRKLISAGARPDTENLQGLTPLMLATQRRHFGTVEQLYIGKADFNYKNEAGQTVLMLAALRNDVRSADVLLDFGASTKIVNRERRNAADIAERLGNSEVLSLLRSR